MNIPNLKKHPTTFARLFGLTPAKFDQLVAELLPRWERAEYRRKTRYARKIKVGSGRPYRLTFEQMMGMYLLYCRTYINHVFLGELFQIDNSGVCRYFKKLAPMLARRFQPLHIRRINLSEEKIMELIVDATEQPTERREGARYSGKRKTHTVKTQVVVTAKGTVLHVSRTVPGNRHDKKLFDQARIALPAGVSLLGDLGYLGAGGIALPHKSSKHHSLTASQQTYNQKHARRRIVVEHAIAHLKQWRILAQRFRNPINTYNHIFTTVCGVRNFATA